MPTFSKIVTLPGEILEEIVVRAVQSSFLGPPVALASFLRVSKVIFKTLARKNNPHLYARIFCIKFDGRLAARRLGHSDSRALDLGDELVRRCEGMARLRLNVYPRAVGSDDPDRELKIDLWMAYLMFLESEGKNSRQLVQYAHLDKFALEFVMPGGRLHDGAPSNEGWTVDNEVNALGLWLFWFTDCQRVKCEDADERCSVLEALAYLYVGSFKYALTHAPLSHFHIHSESLAPVVTDAPTFAFSESPVFPPCTILNHFGHKLTLARPLATPPALLCSVARLKCGGSPSVRARTPATRAEAVQMGWTGATRADYEEFGRLETKFVEWDEKSGESHEHDWYRLMGCHNLHSQALGMSPVYTLGMLDGIWDGRWLAIPPNFFWSLVDNAKEHRPVEPQLQPPIFQQPMQFRIWEHHQCDAESIVPIEDMSTDGEGISSLRAWLPANITTKKLQGNLKIRDLYTKAEYTYQTYDPVYVEELAHLTPGESVKDIILTAETTEMFGDAWGHDHYVGRVRLWDGLVVLVRDARPGAGKWIFRGYIHSDQNLVGRWRETGTPANLPGWEGVWSMAKRQG